MARRRVERFWDAARAKVEHEGRCRVCGSQFFLQFAHTVGRKYDERVDLEDGGVLVYVEPDDGVALCASCHFAYDRHELSILEHLTYAEQAAAVGHVGITRALHRLTGLREMPAAIAPLRA